MGSDNQISRQRAADRLVALFEDQITSGALKEGDTLPPEREMVQQYGVSRTVAREAVLALATKGLVRARPGFRPVVIKPGYDTALDVLGSVAGQLLGRPGGVRNLFDLRIMMEAGLVRQAATDASKEDIKRLLDALEANAEAIGDSAKFYATDTAFHGVLYDIPDNPVLPAIHRAYTEWLAPQWSQMPRMEGRNRGNFEAHERIFHAILHRDPDAAETHLRAHLASAWQQVSTTFDDL